MRAEARVDLGAVRANVRRLVGLAGPAAVMAVVKADGYGHGMVACARAALDGGASWLGVTGAAEALALRAAGVDAPVLAWLLTPSEPMAELVAAGVDVSVSSAAELAAAVAAAGAAGRPAGVHLKLDSGLSRGGAPPAQWAALCRQAVAAAAGGALHVRGVWTHLARADEPGDASVDHQLARFRAALDTAGGLGLHPPLRHVANSAALLTRPDSHFDLVRAGLAVYGISPVAGAGHGLVPAMTLSAEVSLVKRVRAGEGVSYGHRYVTARETTLALVPLGYADGVPRHASNRGEVLLRGRRYRVAGTVCMDQFVVDVGDAVVAPGDRAVLFGPGDAGEPTAADWAVAADTIPYEVLTRVGARVPRVYVG